MVRNRLMDVMMRILLPACFIALKLTGSFIDFMLGLANSNVHEDIEISTSQVRDSQLRGGSNFDPVKYVKEVSHVEHLHADSLLIHPNFSSKLMIT